MPRNKYTLKYHPWAVDILEEAAGILNHLGYKWWLSAGTLLGTYRDNQLIPHDQDIDVGVQELCDHDEIIDAFSVNDYEVLAQGIHQIAFIKRGVIFDIYFYRKEGNKLVCDVSDVGRIIKPYRLFKKLGRINFNHHYYPTPKPIEDYLVIRYGSDWHIPKTKKVPWTEESQNFVKF